MSKKKNKYVLGTQDHKLLLSPESDEAGNKALAKEIEMLNKGEYGF